MAPAPATPGSGASLIQYTYYCIKVRFAYASVNTKGITRLGRGSITRYTLQRQFATVSLLCVMAASGAAVQNWRWGTTKYGKDCIIHQISNIPGGIYIFIMKKRWDEKSSWKCSGSFYFFYTVLYSLVQVICFDLLL